MKVITIIMTTFTVALLGSLLMSLLVSFTDKHDHIFWYAFIMIFGNVILPVLILTALFETIRTRILLRNRLLTFVTTAIVLFLLSIIGLAIMTIMNSNPDYTFFSGLTFEKFRNRFVSNYGGYMLIVVVSSIAIPLNHSAFRKMFRITNQINTAT